MARSRRVGRHDQSLRELDNLRERERSADVQLSGKRHGSHDIGHDPRRGAVSLLEARKGRAETRRLGCLGRAQQASSSFGMIEMQRCRRETFEAQR